MRRRKGMTRAAWGSGVLSAAVLVWVLAGAGAGFVRADEAPAKSAASDSGAAAGKAPGGTAVTKEAGKTTKRSAKKTIGKGKGAVMPETMAVKPAVVPEHVQVQHILIGFAGSVPGKDIRRTKEEAKKLAYEILERARKGEDFDALVRQYTDDSPPGIYGMCGVGVKPGPGEYVRNQMVPAFGNVGFNISPGNIGIADYDARLSPFGWHIIKRLK
jgi:hypothetical protein